MSSALLRFLFDFHSQILNSYGVRSLRNRYFYNNICPTGKQGFCRISFCSALVFLLPHCSKGIVVYIRACRVPRRGRTLQPLAPKSPARVPVRLKKVVEAKGIFCLVGFF